MQDVNKIRNKFKEKLKNKDYVIDKTGVKTVELVGESFIANRPTIFGAMNETYIKKELKWYCDMDLSVHGMENPPKIWKDVSDDDGHIHSNYGYLMFHPGNYKQYKNCVTTLTEDRDSRRGMMIYTRPSIQYEYNRDGMSDFICTNSVQTMIRDNKLYYIVNMRSNDVVFGYRNDFAWHEYIFNKMFSDLKMTYKDLKIGNIIWQVGSLHVYERHFDLIK